MKRALTHLRTIAAAVALLGVLVLKGAAPPVEAQTTLTAPPPPEGFTVSSVEENAVTLQWDHREGIHDYYVSQSLTRARGSWSEAGRPRGDATTLEVSGLSCGTVHYFAIKARGDGQTYLRAFGGYAYARAATADCSDGSTPTPTPTPPNTPPGATPTPTPAPATGESLSDMVKRVRPAVVKVIKHDGEGPAGYGSGFIFRTGDDGSAEILTNQHVIDEASAVHVLVEDETEYEASVLQVDTRRDMALLRICCGEFETVDFMDSDTLHPGDEVIAIGYGQDQYLPRTFRPGRTIVPGEATVTRGIISAFRYDSQMDAQVVQHDAPVNGGNSGGPLLSLDGRVVGVVTFRFVDRPDHDLFREGLHFSVLETTVQERLRLWDLGPSASFGPLSGTIRHEPGDEFIEAFYPRFTTTADEFSIDVTFTNPYAMRELSLDYGISFGRSREPNDQFLYFVVTEYDDKPRWYVYMRDAGRDLQFLHSGIVPQLNLRAGEKNRLTLFVDGRWGDLYVNGQRVEYTEDFGEAKRVNLGLTHIDSHEGEVVIFSGLWNERQNAQVRYEDLTGYTYDHSR